MNTLKAIDWTTLKGATFTPSPLNWEDQILYFLLIDRFSDGQEIGFAISGTTPLFNNQKDNANAVMTDTDAMQWRDTGAAWNGGTLKGIASKIAYLKGMGITTLWISPVLKQVSFENSYHGYGIQDYLCVDPHFGTNNDLRELVKQAHAAGIYVILDIIINHSGNVFDYHDDGSVPGWTGTTYPVKGFRDAAGEAGIPMGAPVTDRNAAIWPAEFQDEAFFTRKGKINNWDHYPEYLEGDFETLKDIHLGTGDNNAYSPSQGLINLCDVYKYWMAYADLDGFRIDTIKHMEQGAVRFVVSVFHEFAQSIGKDNFYLIGEITGGRQNAVDTIDNTGLDAALGIDDIQNRLEGTIKGWTEPEEYFELFRNSLWVGKDSHTWFNGTVVTMIDDHDKVSKGVHKMRFCANGYQNMILNAMAFNITTIGIPCIYYGTEQAFDGQGDNDRYIREAMFGGGFGAFRSKGRHFFIPAQTTYIEFSKLAALRQKHIALRRGRQYLREISGDGISFGPPSFMGPGPIRSVIAWSRIMDSEEMLMVFSNDYGRVLSVWITVDNALNQTGDTFKCLYCSGGELGNVAVEARNGKAVRISLPPGAFAVFKKKA